MTSVRLNETQLRRVIRKIVNEQATPATPRKGADRKALDDALAALETTSPIWDAYPAIIPFFKDNPRMAYAIAKELKKRGWDSEDALDIGDSIEITARGYGLRGRTY